MDQQSSKINNKNKSIASEKHKELAGLIKNTHNRLREESKIYGANEAWSRHLARTKDLKVR